MSEHFEIVRNDAGNYRVYFRKGRGPLHCVQNEGSWGKDDFKFLICSRDGEPSHEVMWPEELLGLDFSDISLEKRQ